MKQKRNKAILAVILAILLCFTYVPPKVREVHAANKVLSGAQIASYCNSLVGQQNPWGLGKGLCLAFVYRVFLSLGAEGSSDCCAYHYSQGRIVSTSRDNIPIGADVFFSGSSIRCDSCGNMCGHIGIYVGDGYVVHLINGVEKTKLSTLDSYSNLTYIGWGIHGNVTLADADNQKPDVQDFHVGEFRTGAFTILSKVTDGSGIKSVQYAVWTMKNDQDDLIWHDAYCTDNNDYYWSRINFTDHKNERGKYVIDIYAIDTYGNCTNKRLIYDFPEKGPDIKDVVVTNISSNGYTVTCKVSNTNKDAGINRVQFPTWTDKNGQDDIAHDWGTNQNVKGTIKDGVATFVVKTSDHNYESGIYHTHIWAYDVFGNATCVKAPDVNVHNHNTVLIKGKPATCTETGLTDGEKCTICNEIIVKQQVIPAKGHTVVIDKGIPATKTSIGLTEGSHCSVCNAVLKRQQVIPALGSNDNQNPTKPTNPTNPTTPSADNGENKQNTDNGVGTISADGRTLTDTDNVKYYVSGKLKNKDLKKNLKIADKKSGGKYKITKVIKKNGKVVGGNVTYMAPYNKNCTKATAGATVKIGGVNFKITALSANAFKNCKKLSTFKAGGNMLTIGKNAFSGCSSLKSVTITSTKLKSIGTGAFKGTTAKTKFKVPKSKLTKYTIMILKAGASINSKITK